MTGPLVSFAAGLALAALLTVSPAALAAAPASPVEPRPHAVATTRDPFLKEIWERNPALRALLRELDRRLALPGVAGDPPPVELAVRVRSLPGPALEALSLMFEDPAGRFHGRLLRAELERRALRDVALVSEVGAHPATSVLFSTDMCPDGRTDAFGSADDTAHTLEFPFSPIRVTGETTLLVATAPGLDPGGLSFIFDVKQCGGAGRPRPLPVRDGRIVIRSVDHDSLLVGLLRKAGHPFTRKYVWVLRRAGN